MASGSEAARRGWYHGWNIVAVAMLAQVAANGLTYNAFSLFLKDWSADLHAPKSQLQLAIAAMGLFAALLSPLVGGWADKYPPRRLFGLGLLGMALFYLAVSFAQAPWQLIALYAFLVPLALGCSTALVANSVIAKWFVKSRGLALGLSAFGIGLAGVFLPPLIAYLLPLIGWRAVWRAGAAIVALIVAPLVVMVVRTKPSERDGLDYIAGAADGHASGHVHGHGGGKGIGWRAVFARRNFWILVATYLPIMMLQGGIGNNLAPIALAQGLSQQTAGNLMSAFAFAHVVATLALGLISDRFGNRLALAGLALIVAVGGALVAFGSGLPVLTVGTILAGFGGGVFTLLAAGIAVEFGAEATGQAFGLAMFFLPIGALAPFIIALSKEKTGSYAPALLGLAALVVVASVLALLLRERRGGHRTDAERAAAAEEAVSTPT
jgi:MFS family permease